MFLARLAFSCLVLLAGTSVVVVARAQTPSPEVVAAARALSIEGIQLADAGRCSEAIDKLSRSEALYHAPTTLARLGECQVAAGQVVLGTENLNRVVREQLGENPPQAFVQAQQRAAGVLEQARGKIAYLVVQVQPSEAEVRVTVNGVEVPRPLLGVARPTDPGQHEVRVEAPGFVPAAQTVELREGDRQELAFTLTPAPQDPGVAQPVPAAPAAPPPDSAVYADAGTAPGPSKQRSLVPAYIAFGVGAVGLTVGTVAGIVASNKESALACPDKRCPVSEHDDLDSANAMATISTVGFVVGVAGGAAGVVLLLVGSGSKEAPVAARWGSVTAQPFVGARSAGFVGTF
jgi:hypothetical protein